MLKGIGLFILCFVVILALLVFLQPSSQESATTSLVAAEKVLEDVKASEGATKLDDARRILVNLRLPPELQDGRDKAIASIDDAKAAIGSDQAKLTAATAAAKAQIALAKSNLTASTAAERVRVVKDQMLALAWPVVIAILVLYIFTSKAALEVLKYMGSLVSNVKVPGGLEIAFAGGAVVKNNQEEVIKGYRQQVITQYDVAAAQNQISDTVERIIKDRIEPFFSSHALKQQFRCTIHVRDILFQSSLYELDRLSPKKMVHCRKSQSRACMVSPIWPHWAMLAA